MPPSVSVSRGLSLNHRTAQSRWTKEPASGLVSALSPTSSLRRWSGCTDGKACALRREHVALEDASRQHMALKLAAHTDVARRGEDNTLVECVAVWCASMFWVDRVVREGALWRRSLLLGVDEISVAGVGGNLQCGTSKRGGIDASVSARQA